MYPENLKKFDLKNYKKFKIKTKIFSQIVKCNFDFLNIDCEGNDLKILKFSKTLHEVKNKVF